MKKLLFLLFAVLIPVYIQAAISNGTTGDCIWSYNSSNKTLTISGSGNMADYTVSSSTPWKSFKSDITTVVIGSGVTSIGNYAFCDMKNLVTVSNNSLSSIGDYAFYGCAKLASIKFSSTTTRIGDYAFSGCTSLVALKVPASVVSIGNRAFLNCNNIAKIEFEESTTPISLSTSNQYSPFDGCTSVSSVVVNRDFTWTYQSTSPFKGCTSYYSLTIGGQSNSIGAYAFQNCKGIISLKIGANVSAVGVGAFINCTNLSKIALLESSTALNFSTTSSTSTFGGCSAVTSIAIGRIFYQSYKWTSPFTGCTGSYAVTINGINNLSTYAFYKCTGLSTVKFDSDLTNIGEYAFSGCSNLTYINLGDNNGSECNISTIGAYAFNDCEKMTTLTIGSNVLTIKDYAFKNCTSLLTVKIEDTPISLSCGNEIFDYCKAISNVYLGRPLKYSSSYSPFRNKENLTSVIIGDEVTEIGYYAFSGCSKLSNIKMGEMVTTISEWAFADCTSLMNIKFDDILQTIKSYAFMRCSGLSSLTIPVSVNNIASTAFLYCQNLQEISVEEGNSRYDSRDNCNAIVNKKDNSIILGCTKTIIPESVVSFGEYAYAGQGFKSFEIPRHITSIGRGCFRSCNSLTSLTVGNGNNVYDSRNNCNAIMKTSTNELVAGCNTSVIPDETISIMDFAFFQMGFSTIVIPDNVEKIGNASFQYCKNLKKISLPKNLRTIGKNTFSYCSALEEIYLESDSCVASDYPSGTINDRCFYGTDISKMSLYVPKDRMEYYSNLEPWKDFKTILDLSEKSFMLTCIIDGDVYLTEEIQYGSPLKEFLNDPEKEGYTFSGWSKVLETMPAHDVTITGSFTINKYTLTYMVDGEVYKTVEVEYGSEIVPEAAPEKEGNTFSGWSEIPTTMPNQDVTVTGTFTINKYTLTYMLDGETYKTYEVEYGSEIIPQTAPEKEGYTFSGWSGILETMPAHDVTVTGTFTINKYTLTYMVDGEVYKTVEVEYGSEIVPEAAPEKEGNTFSGWSEIPETMPANNVTVTGAFTINKYTLTYMVDGETYKTYEVDYGSAITPESEPTKEGYTFSGWSEIPETMPSNDVTVTGTFTWVDAIAGITTDECDYQIFTPDGRLVNNLQKGLNIIRLSNGQMKKLMVK